MSVKTPKNKCLEDLRLRILTQEIEPGADLDEQSLSSAYEISRTPLREVLQRLAGEGYLRQTANRGAKVASLDLETLRTFFQTAPLVYSAIARMAATNRKRDQIEALKEIQVKFKRSVRDGKPMETSLHNHAFHDKIAEMAHNPYLIISLRRMLIDHTRLSQVFYRPESEQETALVKKAEHQHEAMISAIESSQEDMMVDLTLKHWDLSRDRMERFVQPDPLPVNLVLVKGA